MSDLIEKIRENAEYLDHAILEFIMNRGDVDRDHMLFQIGIFYEINTQTLAVLPDPPGMNEKFKNKK